MRPQICAPEIDDYLRRQLIERDDVALEMEQIGSQRRFPIIGPVVGQFVAGWARAVGARRVLEMGSGFGYSTWWFAHAVGPEGSVIHTDGDQRNSDQAREFLTRAGLAARVSFRVGDARQIAREEDGPFDLIFCDIDKEQYPDVPEIALPRLRVGGALIFDNMLWSARVLDPTIEEECTVGVRRVTELLCRDPRLWTTIVPLRDGVSVTIKLRN